MQKFIEHVGIVAPIITDNVDTDQIIPSREMKRVSKSGLGEGLFAGWRYQYDGMKKVGLLPEFVLNKQQYRDASIILGGKNWGCGSSREHAVWALRDYGIRVIIAESFGQIFHGNSARNGLLAITLNGEQIDRLAALTRDDPQDQRLRISLASGEIHAPDGTVMKFDIPRPDYNMLINGLDHIEYTMRHVQAIDEFRMRDRAMRPWAYL